jgi:hypothetical protein
MGEHRTRPVIVEGILSGLTLPMLPNRKNTSCSFSTPCLRIKATFFDPRMANMQEQYQSGPQVTAEVLPVNAAAMAPAGPAVHRGARRRFLIALLFGFSVLLLGLLAGEQVKMWLHRVVGLALGCASHGVGAARAFEIDSTAGAFASVGMSLTAIFAGIISRGFCV